MFVSLGGSGWPLGGNRGTFSIEPICMADGGMGNRIEHESDENKINIFPLFNSSVVLYSGLGMLLGKTAKESCHGR